MVATLLLPPAEFASMLYWLALVSESSGVGGDKLQHDLELLR